MSLEWLKFHEYRISMVFLLAYLVLFLRLRYGAVINALLCAACYALTAAMDYLLFFVLPDTLLASVTIGEIAVVQLTAIFLSDYRDFRAVFTGVSSAAYVLLGNVVCGTVFALTGNAPLALGLQVCLHLGLLLLLNRFLRPLYLAEIDRTAHGWGLLSFIPAVFYAAAFALTIWPSNLYQNPAVALGTMMTLAALVAAYGLLFSFLAQRRDENLLAQDKLFLESYAAGLRHDAEAMRRAEEQTALWRHDTRHWTRMLKAALDAGETAQAYEILRGIDANLDKSIPRHFCANIAVNSVLTAYTAKAAQAGVTLYCKTDVPAELPSANEFEFATVISNLVENALQAAAQVPSPEERAVWVDIRPYKNQLSVDISNTCVGTVALSPQTSLPLSAKGEGHGIGLRSVRSYATKHDALFNCIAKDGQFRVQLLAPL